MSYNKDLIRLQGIISASLRGQKRQLSLLNKCCFYVPSKEESAKATMMEIENDFAKCRSHIKRDTARIDALNILLLGGKFIEEHKSTLLGIKSSDYDGLSWIEDVIKEATEKQELNKDEGIQPKTTFGK